MNTDEVLKIKFCNKEYNLLKKKIEKVDIDFVVLYLLKYDFIVDINGNKYDITFGKNKKDEIGSCIRYYPNSKPLCSYEIIEKGFKEGTWYVVTDEDLTEGEFKKAEQEINKLKKAKELLDRKEFIDEVIIEVLKDNPKFDAKNIKQQFMSLSSEDFDKMWDKLLK